jgi:hypothetical protein
LEEVPHLASLHSTAVRQRKGEELWLTTVTVTDGIVDFPEERKDTPVDHQRGIAEHNDSARHW